MTETLNEALDERIDLFPKPTPLLFLESLSSDLDVDSYLKRDDLTAIGGGGNKARKLEFIAYEAIEAGADKLVTIGSMQSNHARMTAAVANRLGLDCHLLLIGGEHEENIEGNRLLETILDAEITYTTASDASDDIDTVIDQLEASGASPYFIEGGGHTPTGALGYLKCTKEILQQTPDTVDYIVTTTGTGTTQAGLIAGIAWNELSAEAIGISVARSESQCREEIEEILASLDERFIELTVTEHAITVFVYYLGEKYGELTAQARDAIKELSQAEGLFLDPIYTGKAFAGFLDLVETEYIEPGSTVVFLHTGGLPGLFISRFEKREIWEA